jgi:hypothetical protein
MIKIQREGQKHRENAEKNIISEEQLALLRLM